VLLIKWLCRNSKIPGDLDPGESLLMNATLSDETIGFGTWKPVIANGEETGGASLDFSHSFPE
jgi:hypothetical protein